VPEEKRFDVIFCNPPYVRSDTPLSPEVLQDPAEALYGEGDDGFDIPRKIIQNLPNLIAKDGYFIIEHMEDQGELAYQALKKTGLNNIKTIDDLTGRPRFTFACWKSGK
jgi:release factor glutamine methyltransferase